MQVGLRTVGTVTALGADAAITSSALFAGQLPGFAKYTIRSNETTVPVGRIQSPLPKLSKQFFMYQCRNHAIGYGAYLQIEKDVQRLKSSLDPKRIGVVIGSSTSGLDATEKAYVHFNKTGCLPDDFNIETQHAMGSFAKLIAGLAGISGPAYTVSTACSSSAKAMLSARGLIALDICDAVICGGVDTLCDLTINGFSALASLSDARMNPFSQNRKGLNIGEGAALFLMTRDFADCPVALLGGGETMDAHHMSAPHPEGIGAAAAMRAALDDAQLTAEQILYVNLHGTGTKANDAMESKACRAVFDHPVKVSSTKPFTGHCLGAAGAVELAHCFLSLTSSERFLPPHIFDNQLDPELPSLSFVTVGDTYSSEVAPYFISNSFAFGGNNCALVLGKGKGR